MNATRLPILPCACGSLRRASRALTQLYEHELQSTGLRATQLTILQALSRTGTVSQGRLGEILAMDSTTLTRTLKIMRRHRWIDEKRGKDRRERQLSLATAGTAQLKRASRGWEKVQAGLHKDLGERRWKDLLELTRQIAELVTKQGGSK